MAMFSFLSPAILCIVICGSANRVVAGQDVKQRPEIYSLHITSDVKYRFATTLVTSRVKNPDNKSREAVFDVTLPNEAFITNFTLEIDGRIVVGEIKEKEAAKQQYEAARARGESAGYIGTQQRNTNKFNLAVTVAPISKVSFNLTYQELLRRRLGHYEQVIYIDPGQPVPDMHVTVAILESREITELLVPPLRNDIDVDISGTNSIVIIEQPTPTTAYIKYIPNVEHQTAVSANGIAGQFVVKYDVKRDMDGGDLLVVNGYFVHFFAPEGFSPIPKDVLFVLDTSGSMIGKKIKQLRQAMASILDQLHEGDRINIMTFSGSNSFWKTEMVEVGEDGVLSEARRHVESLSANGWTNIDLALTSGLKFLANRVDEAGSVRSPLLVFLTDGEATKGVRDTPTILRNVQAANEGGVPIFCLAFGQDADFDLVKKVAIQNNGLGRKIFEASDAAMQISNFYEEISVTLLNNVTFTYLDAPVANVTKHRYNNYFKGSEMVVCGKFTDLSINETEGITLQVQGNSVDGPSMLIVSSAHMQGAFDYMNNVTGVGDYERITEKVWAYLTIKQLMDKKLASSDPVEKSAYNRQVLELSLKYGFVTPLTSMVVTQANDDEVAAMDDNEAGNVETVNVLHIAPSRPILPRRPDFGMMYSMIPRRQHSRVGTPLMHAKIQRRRYHSPPMATDPRSQSKFSADDTPIRRSRLEQFDLIQDLRRPHTGSRHTPPPPTTVTSTRKIQQTRRNGRKHDKKGGRKLSGFDASLKVNMTSLEVPICFRMYDSGQSDSALYTMYNNPTHDILIVAELEMVTLKKRYKRGVVDSVAITTRTTTTNLTSNRLVHSSTVNPTMRVNATWTDYVAMTVPGEIEIEPHPDYIKVDLGRIGMYVSRSNVNDGLSINIYSYADVTSDVTGIIGQIISRNVELTMMKTKRGPRRQKIVGILKSQGSRRKMRGWLKHVTPAGPAQSWDKCWALRKKNEEWFYTVSKYRL